MRVSCDTYDDLSSALIEIFEQYITHCENKLSEVGDNNDRLVHIGELHGILNTINTLNGVYMCQLDSDEKLISKISDIFHKHMDTKEIMYWKGRAPWIDEKS